MGHEVRKYGISVGKLSTGKRNAITDVPGVKVGHHTLAEGDVQTGVTAIIPHEGNLFQKKVPAASHVINGFGKTAGSIQIEELGTLETPVILTNTFGVGTAIDAVIDYTLERNEEIGRETGTVNAVVGECNDMILNDIRRRTIRREHIHSAIEKADKHFGEGAVGAGRGMVCYSLKGGIGSASRILPIGSKDYTIGVLTLTNFGTLRDLRIDGRAAGEEWHAEKEAKEEKDKGSVMIVVATDLPVTDRQLQRIIKRSVIGLSRTGAMISNGSGDIALGFSTAYNIPAKPSSVHMIPTIHEEEIDTAFRGVAEATEEAVLQSLFCAETVTGRDGNIRRSITELLSESLVSKGENP
ncbi:UNVERIFIED_CONTAM: P1 family peptidase [Halobacillus marinus]